MGILNKKDIMSDAQKATAAWLVDSTKKIWVSANPIECIEGYNFTAGANYGGRVKGGLIAMGDIGW